MRAEAPLKSRIFSKVFGYFPYLCGMVEIDNLNRIKLSDLKSFFTNSKRLREAVAQAFERKPNLTGEQMAEEKERYITGTREYFHRRLSFEDGLSFEVETLLDSYSLEIYGFLFKWQGYDGEDYSKRVYLEARPSNLGLPEPVYYFVCPNSGKLCRKLYTDGRVLTSRWSFSHTYSKRNESHQWREFRQYLNLTIEVEEGFRYRKETYRGKLTPHGKRMERKLRKALQCGAQLSDILSSRDRGRPRKTKEPPLFLK